MPSSKRRLWIVGALLVALCGLRAIHLGADTPRELTSWSVGIFVDEGYKTLDARNQVLFGQSHWNAEDNYDGWTARSPLTHWLYRGAFEVFGAELWSARTTTIAWFALFLGAFAAAFLGRYGLALTSLGLVLLGIQHTLFFFSRVALLELPVIACIYGLLFALAAREHWSDFRALLALAVAIGVVTLGIKNSAPIYFVPVAAGLLVGPIRRGRRVGLTWLIALAGALCVGAWLTHSIWRERIDLNVLDAPQRILAGTFMHSTAPLAALGLFCAFHALWVRPQAFLENRYRVCLIALVLLGPVMISLFRYRPLRYYVPFLPAYVLLALEWFDSRAWRWKPPEGGTKLATALVLAILTAFLFSLGSALHSHVLVTFLPDWTLPEGVPRIGLAALVAGVVGLLWFARRRVPLAVFPPVFVGLVAFSAIRDVQIVGHFLRSPTFEARLAASKLEAELPQGASIAGDWAPILTLGTSVRALYSNPIVNHAGRFDRLRPDYFLFTGKAAWTPGNERDVRETLKRRGWIVPEPVLELDYMNRPALVYRLEYPGD